MNLLVEKCDCTITAVYKDIEGDYKTVTVMNADGKETYAQYNAMVGDGVSVKAPVAQNGLTFDKWETSADLGETDLTCSEIWVPVDADDVTLTPTYKVPEKPCFNVKVETGEGGNGQSAGTGSYYAGEKVELAAAIPQDGYMFSHWENVDFYGGSTGISMENEYYWNTTFEMVDRFEAVCETMYNNGVTAIFDGGNSMDKTAYNAKWDYSYNLNVISAGADNKDALITIVKDYGKAVQDALADFKGGTVVLQDCSTEGIYATNVPDDENIKAQYDAVYNTLAKGEIEMIAVQGGAGYDYCKIYEMQKPFKCLTLDAWFLEGVALG